MPELPEVQALADHLAARVTGRTVTRVDVLSVSALKTFDPPLAELCGREVTAVTRHGKFLDLATGGGPHLVLHLARAGWIQYREDFPAEAGPRRARGPVALRVVLDDGSGFQVTEQGTTKAVAAYVVRDPLRVPGVARLGADPLAEPFTAERLASLASGSRHRLKTFLTDQAVLAGIGNAYSDEILHTARLSPYAMASSLDEERAARLHTAIRQVLGAAVERAAGVAARNLKAEKREGMRVHGRDGQPCPVCGDTVRSVRFSDSSLQYCPTCQTGGRTLADRRLSRLLK
ncbi:Fpg/Nei family DNA glycosylase [Streptomyces capparidis]